MATSTISPQRVAKGIWMAQYPAESGATATIPIRNGEKTLLVLSSSNTVDRSMYVLNATSAGYVSYTAIKAASSSITIDTSTANICSVVNGSTAYMWILAISFGLST